MNRLLSTLALILGFATFAFTGCQTSGPTQVDRGYTAPAQPAKTQWQAAFSQAATPTKAVKHTAVRSDADVIFKSNQIKVSKSVLETASVGGTITYRIQIQALEDVSTVRVTETMPAGIQFKSARPTTSLSGNNASWVFPSMKQGKTQNIDVTVT
ncbi:MAG: hypothetical protein ACI9A1_001085, partial [Lentimonas sp.]